MSKLFRFSESLGKSNGKKWSQIWKLLLIKGVESPQQKKNFTDFLHLFTPFKPLFAPTFWSPMSKKFWFSESLWKSNGKKGSQIVKLLLIKGLHLPHKKSCFFGEWCSLRINLYFVSWSSITYHLSPVTCHLSPVTCHLSPVTCHPSPVNCHLPPAICNPSSDHN